MPVVTTTPYGWRSQQAPIVVPPSGFYQVSGTKVFAPNGTEFYPFGANIGLHYTNFPYPFLDFFSPILGSIHSKQDDPINFPSHVDDALTWGWNMVRVNAVGFNDDPSFFPVALTATAQANLMTHGVSEIMNGGLVVLMDARMHQPGDNTSTLGSINDQRTRQFHGRMLQLYADNPRYWINPFNEPFDWDHPAQINQMIAINTSWISFLRAEGYRNPIVFDLPRYAQGIDRVADGTFDAFMALDDNLILSWHDYGLPTGVAADTTNVLRQSLAAAAHARGHCIIIGELGVNDTQEPPVPVPNSWQATVAASNWALVDGNAQALDMGVLVWHAGHDMNTFVTRGAGGRVRPFFTSPNNGTELSVFGQKVWNRGQLLKG